MAVQKKIKTKENLFDVINYFKELSFCNTSTKKPKIKRLKNIDLLSELPIYNELSVVKTEKSI